MDRLTWLLIGAVALALLYEILAARRHDPRPTISEIVWAASKRTPIVPFLAGVLAGHLFA